MNSIFILIDICEIYFC